MGPWWLTWHLCLYICEKCEMSRLWHTDTRTDSGKVGQYSVWAESAINCVLYITTRLLLLTQWMVSPNIWIHCFQRLKLMLLPPRCQKIGTPHILDMDITRDALPKTLHKIKGSSNCSCTNRKKRKGNSILRRVVPRLHFPVDETGSLSPLDFPEKPKIPFLCVKVCQGWAGIPFCLINSWEIPTNL